MKKRTVIKNGFYKKYEEDQKTAIKPKQQSDKPKDSIAKVTYNILCAIFRIIGYVLLFGLSSVGLTALLNEEIRKLLLNLL